MGLRDRLKGMIGKTLGREPAEPPVRTVEAARSSPTAPPQPVRAASGKPSQEPGARPSSPLAAPAEPASQPTAMPAPQPTAMPASQLEAPAAPPPPVPGTDPRRGEGRDAAPQSQQSAPAAAPPPVPGTALRTEEAAPVSQPEAPAAPPPPVPAASPPPVPGTSARSGDDAQATPTAPVEQRAGGLTSGNDAPTRQSYVRGPFTTSEAAFSVRLVNAAMGIDRVVPCEPGEWVLDAADRAGIVLPSSCRNGGCLTCTGRLVAGATEMEEQYTLEEEHIARGFRLLCVTRVLCDAEFVTHQQDEVQ